MVAFQPPRFEIFTSRLAWSEAAETLWPKSAHRPSVHPSLIQRNTSTWRLLSGVSMAMSHCTIASIAGDLTMNPGAKRLYFIPQSSSLHAGAAAFRGTPTHDRVSGRGR
jgi:hypothetical protein